MSFKNPSRHDYDDYDDYDDFPHYPQRRRLRQQAEFPPTILLFYGGFTVKKSISNPQILECFGVIIYTKRYKDVQYTNYDNNP